MNFSPPFPVPLRASITFVISATTLLYGYSLSLADVTPAPDIGWIDVTEHGALPDDGIDDTAIIQQLVTENINKVNSGGVRTIYFPDGVYTISDTILWKDFLDKWKAYLIFRGQSRDGTILRLTDNTFTDPGNSQAVIFTASSRGGDPSEKPDGVGNTAFFNFIQDLTVDTGTGNTGAIGIDYLNSNVGALRNVRVVSSDPDRVGLVGINMSRDWPGPSMLKNVEVIGFNYGLDFREKTTYKTVAEELYLSEQKLAGIRNNAHPLSIRKLYSTNSVPVLISEDTSRRASAMTVILEGRFEGGDPDRYAIEYEMGLYLRDVEISGYRDLPIRDNNNDLDTGGRYIWEFVSHEPYTEFSSPARSLHLPIEETPDGPDDPSSEWVKVEGTDSAAVQAAIDKANFEGKSTIYFPTGAYLFGEPIMVSGSIRRVFGNGSTFTFRPRTADRSVFVLQDLEGPDITFDTFVTFALVTGEDDTFTWVYDDSDVPVVLKDIMAQSNIRHYHNVRPTKVFIENCAFGHTTFTNAQVWARQFDPENQDVTKIINRGSDLWILGLKTEWPSTVLENMDGARTELLGTLFYPPSGSNPRSGGITILNEESQLSYVGVSHGEANRIQVRDIQNGETRDYAIRDSSLAGHPKNGLATPLYSSWRGTIPESPSGLQAFGAVQLTWVDGSDNETGFLVERRVPGGNWEIVSDGIGSDVVTFLDPDVEAGQVYDYRVFSVLDGVRSAPTERVTIEANEGETWFGYPVILDGWVYAADWFGYGYVGHAPWIWIHSLNGYAYIATDEGWIYVPRAVPTN
jgi:hypothetical protein